MDLTKLANFKRSYSASLSGVGGSKKRVVGTIRGRRKKAKCKNTTEATMQALVKRCIVKVTADMRRPKSQSHGRCLMSSM